jgi:5-methylcytosine-specific restriction protein B
LAFLSNPGFESPLLAGLHRLVEKLLNRLEQLHAVLLQDDRVCVRAISDLVPAPRNLRPGHFQPTCSASRQLTADNRPEILPSCNPLLLTLGEHAVANALRGTTRRGLKPKEGGVAMKRPSQDLVDAFFEWYHASAHAQNEDHYAGSVTAEALGRLTRDAFIEFFLQFARDGGMIQSGGYRTAPLFQKSIQSNYESFRTFALQPFAEGFDELTWLNRIDEFPGFGQGLATIYLNRVDKNRYAIVNNKAIAAIKLFDVDVPVALAKRYVAIRDAERQIIQWFPQFENFFRADALSQFLVGEEVGRAWLEKLQGNSNTAGRSWIYAPGERARLWEQYHSEGVIGIGWDELNMDLGSLKQESELRKVFDAAYGDRASDIDFRQLCDFMLKMRPGDSVFVKRGTGEIVGYGQVASDYFFDGSRPGYRHLRKARWLKAGTWSIPVGEKSLPVKTLTEIRDGERREALMSLIGDAPGNVLFDVKAFELLAELHAHPFLSFYETHAKEFDTAIETPLKQLMSKVAGDLPSSITDVLETQKRLFSRIAKNDYGRGGAWDYYWGAFYPKGGKRIADPQLYVFISSKGLRFGFYIGDYGVDPRTRFARNCSEHGAVLEKLLEPALVGSDLLFGDPAQAEGHAAVAPSREPTWSEWLADPEKLGFRVMIELPADAVVTMSEAAVRAEVVKTFTRLFPLVILAQSDAPLEPIRRFLGTEVTESEEKNPIYTLDEVANDTNIGRGDLEKWVRAIKRKSQAILYGPPGTGKTFLARLLARHLIGGGDGFYDVIQFHPSYAYEDFMQGMRPKALKGGGLEYPMAPGRFKDFCERATECKDPCVLVIDEINRANLARVFGELMYLLEYRQESIPLAGGDRFAVPSNVLIIGTMNTADRSIALVDHALRRRFAFLGLYPNYDILRTYHAGSSFNPEGLIRVLERMNAAINDRHYSVGVTFFLDREIGTRLRDVLQMEIEPYVEELFFDQQEKAVSFTWEKVEDEIAGK